MESFTIDRSRRTFFLTSASVDSIAAFITSVAFNGIIAEFLPSFFFIHHLNGLFHRFCRARTSFYDVSVVLLGFYWVLLGFIGLYWVLLDFTGFYLVLLGFNGFYLVLLGFNGLYWVVLGFTGFHFLFRRSARTLHSEMNRWAAAETAGLVTLMIL